ncbi:hypothetical protein CHARACLAT_009063 [Characodon lateralis]|uniref:Uncharacterized protein n=1 Tax=Characodon lateralis TaxID=208331 RepID=A0ABU7CMG0_9TELE|nr:hypothetical protein [Characodon lateralis]
MLTSADLRQMFTERRANSVLHTLNSSQSCTVTIILETVKASELQPPAQKNKKRFGDQHFVNNSEEEEQKTNKCWIRLKDSASWSSGWNSFLCQRNGSDVSTDSGPRQLVWCFRTSSRSQLMEM